MRSRDMRVFLSLRPKATVREFAFWCWFVKMLGSHKGYRFDKLNDHDSVNGIIIGVDFGGEA